MAIQRFMVESESPVSAVLSALASQSDSLIRHQCQRTYLAEFFPYFPPRVTPIIANV